MNAPWSDSEVRILRSMWLEGGYSLSEIAATLSKTRNAIAGKIKRLGLKGRGARVARPSQQSFEKGWHA